MSKETIRPRVLILPDRVYDIYIEAAKYSTSIFVKRTKKGLKRYYVDKAFYKDEDWYCQGLKLIRASDLLL